MSNQSDMSTEQFDDQSVRSGQAENTEIMNPHVRSVLEQALANRDVDSEEAFNTFVAYNRTPVGG